MTIMLNGKPTDLTAVATVADAVARLGSGPTGVAVAVNDEVVPRASWSTTVLRPGDRVEVLTAVQGG
jgi:sulfur carrier protein